MMVARFLFFCLPNNICSNKNGRVFQAPTGKLCQTLDIYRKSSLFKIEKQVSLYHLQPHFTAYYNEFAEEMNGASQH